MADKILTWYFDQAEVGDAQGPTYEMDAEYRPCRIWLHVDSAPIGSNLIIDIDVTFENVTTSIFTTPLPGLQAGSRFGERDYFADPRILPKGSIVTFNIDQTGSGEAGKPLSVQLELEKTEQEE